MGGWYALGSITGGGRSSSLSREWAGSVVAILGRDNGYIEHYVLECKWDLLRPRVQDDFEVVAMSSRCSDM